MRVATIAHCRGHCARIEHHRARLVVDLAGGHPRLDEPGQFVEYFGRKPAGLAHALVAVRPVELDRTVAINGLVAFDYLIFGHAAHIVARPANCEGPSASR